MSSNDSGGHDARSVRGNDYRSPDIWIPSKSQTLLLLLWSGVLAVTFAVVVCANVSRLTPSGLGNLTVRRAVWVGVVVRAISVRVLSSSFSNDMLSCAHNSRGTSSGL